MSKNLNEEIHNKTEEFFIQEGKLKATIARRGDIIAKDHGWNNLDGMNAIYRYLIDKYHWLPDQVRNLPVDDLVLLLEGYQKPGKVLPE